MSNCYKILDGCSRLFKIGLALTCAGLNLTRCFALGTSALLLISKLWKIKLLLNQTRILGNYFHIYKQALNVATSQFQLRSSPLGRTPGNLTFQKKFGQISHCAGENHRQIPLRPGWPPPDIHDCLYCNVYWKNIISLIITN